MQNDENWESEIDWSRRTSVVGGPIFYEFIKAQALPTLDEGILALEAAKAVCEDKMRRWGAIAERAGKLAECFASLTECEDFMTMIHDFDDKTTEMFKGEAIPTLGGWLRLGKRFTDAMRDGSSVPTKYASELADTKRDIANATAVRDVLRAFVAASDDDYRLRCAPERYRMRVFRDFAKDVGDIAEAGARVNFVTMPDFLNGVGEALKVIIEVGNRMQGICRRAKKSIKRHGNAFWLKLDEWNALRCAV
ncbi:MAG: hypothetical protein J6T51_05075 [Kiritimatiellae bacterium]|nr:hypothetical protein [Kiritimatiellia bacterium]